jgi:hypothetical protein
VEQMRKMLESGVQGSLECGMTLKKA